MIQTYACLKKYVFNHRPTQYANQNHTQKNQTDPKLSDTKNLQENKSFFHVRGLRVWVVIYQYGRQGPIEPITTNETYHIESSPPP